MTSSTQGGRRSVVVLFGVILALAVTQLAFQIPTRAFPLPGGWGFRGFPVVFGLVFGSVGALVAWRHPRNPIGWLFLSTAVLVLVQGVGREYIARGVLIEPGSLPATDALAAVVSSVWIPGVAPMLVFLPLLFPDGRLLSPRWRIVGRVGVAGMVVAFVGTLLTPGPLQETPYLDNPIGLVRFATLIEAASYAGMLTFIGASLAGIVSLVMRLRRARGDERQQLRWFVSAATFAGLSMVIGATSTSGSLSSETAELLTLAGMGSLPIAAGVSILKYRLYDIDIVISRTVVFAALAGFITAVYVAVVVGIGAVIGSGGETNTANLALSVAATAIVAIAFGPVRERLRRFANRLVYGKRATPYEAIGGFAHRMSGALSVDEVLPRMAQAIAEGVGSAHTRVRVALPNGDQRDAHWPEDATDERFDVVLQVSHAGAPVGEIAVAKPSGERLAPTEEKLLADLAAQAGLAMRNAALAAELEDRLEEISEQADELRRSRQRIVTAQDRERRRMESDIHDGAQQHLVALAVKLKLARTVAERDPERAKGLLGELKEETGAALETLRSLARGIYPSILADRGLEAAIRSHSDRAGLDAAIDAIGLDRYPQEVETAVYFCVLEALQNATKHAPDAPVTVRLAHADDRLEFEVTDGGPGFDPSAVTSGLGTQNMTDRIEALGGRVTIESSPGQGTSVKGSVPAQVAVSA